MSLALDIKMESPSSRPDVRQNSGQPVGSMSSGPVFVVGMWRSGTSLLYALLNQHPQIGLMYESDFPLLSPLFFLPRKSSSWIPKVDSWNGALTRHKIDSASIPENTVGLPNAFREVAKQYARKKGATVWGCKSPNYYDCMNQLADWFPDAKFIVIWRDPADVCRSIVRAAKKSPWFARPGMDLRALLGCRRMKEEADQLVRRGAAIHQLQYDDSSARTGRRIDRHLRFHRRALRSQNEFSRGRRPLRHLQRRPSFHGKKCQHRGRSPAPRSALSRTQAKNPALHRILARTI